MKYILLIMCFVSLSFAIRFEDPTPITKQDLRKMEIEILFFSVPEEYQWCVNLYSLAKHKEYNPSNEVKEKCKKKYKLNIK